ncbi:MAG TPA: NepR family anti-sigma factor [Roseiarcus sp.]
MLSMNAARVSKFEKPGPAPDVPAESGAEAVQAIGRALEAHYADLVQAPLPDKFLQLLARLEDDNSAPKAKGKRDALG